MRNHFIQRFLRLESASGILLFLMTALALILSNSPLMAEYQFIFMTPIHLPAFHFQSAHPLLFWINEGLMSLFFLLVGLELKRELTEGKLSRLSNIVLPGVAALGGMIVPALVYLGFNRSHAATINGWAIPVATDIAFALGVLTLLGKRIPIELKLFLMTLAIFDDVGAIFIISVFYTSQLSLVALGLAVFLFCILFLFNRLGVKKKFPYLVVGLLMWVSVFSSGINPTLAGLLLGFIIPRDRFAKLEQQLHPWVAFFIIPLFALANAGLCFGGVTKSVLVSPLVLGILFGLLIGKQLGVMGFSWILVRLKWAALPGQTSWLAMYGVALLCGIGFTMSLFLGTLAFQGTEALLLEMRFGVLAGSLLSGLLGATILFIALRKEKVPRERC